MRRPPDPPGHADGGARARVPVLPSGRDAAPGQPHRRRSGMIPRRHLMAALVTAFGAAAGSRSASGQQPATTLPRLGVLLNNEPHGPVYDALLQALAELGHIAGRTVH